MGGIIAGREYAIVAVEGIDGSGKSTLVRSLHRELSGNQRVLIDKPTRKTISAFRSMVERPDDDSVLYQHILPDSYRTAAYHFEASVQFRYRAEEYAEHDVLIFDRWWHTWDVYCAPVDEHEELFAGLRARLPVPDMLFHVTVDPRLAYDRLVARDDRWVRAYSPEALREKLRFLHDRYLRVMSGQPGVVTLDGAADPREVLDMALREVNRVPAASVR